MKTNQHKAAEFTSLTVDVKNNGCYFLL